MTVANPLPCKIPPDTAVTPAWADVVPLRRTRFSRRSLGRGEALYSAGDAFRALYVVCGGILKSFVVSLGGQVQVTGFQIVGDIAGLDGIGAGLHQTHAVALESAEVFVVPFPQCEQWSRDSAYGQHLLMRTLASEIVRNRRHLMTLGSMRAERRMAIFLLDISERYERLELSRSCFVLGMSRQELGSYLGLTLETVSRLLSRFQREGILQMQGKSVALLDYPALRRMAGHASIFPNPIALPIIDGNGEFVVAH